MASQSLQDKPEDIFLWAVERCPQTIINIDLNNKNQYLEKAPKFNNLYINVSQVIKSILKKARFNKIKDLIVPLKAKLNEIIDLVQPDTCIYFAIDGTRPAALLKKEKEQLFKMGDFSGNFLSLNHMLPCSDNIKQIETAIQDVLAVKIYQQSNNVNAILSDSSLPGDASQKINEFIRQLRSNEGYNTNTIHCMVDNTTEGFINGLVSHELHFYNLNINTFNSSQNRCLKCERTGHFYDTCLGNEDKYFQVEFSNPNYQLYDYQEFRKFLEFEFSYLNFNDYNLERVIDDLVLLILISEGSLALPKLSFLPLLKGGLDVLFYIYKRSLPHLGYLCERQSIYQIRMCLFFKEISNVEDIVIKNFIRESEMKKYKNPRAYEAWQEFVKDLKKRMDEDFKQEEEEEIKYQAEQQAQAEKEKVAALLNTGDDVKKAIDQDLKQDGDDKKEEKKEGETTEGEEKKQDEEQDKKQDEQQQEQQQEEKNKEQIEQEQLEQQEKIEEEQVGQPVAESVKINQNKLEDYITLDKIKSQQFNCIDKAFFSFEEIQVDFSRQMERFLEGISYNEIFNKPGENSLSYKENWDSKNEQDMKLKNVGEIDFKTQFYMTKFKIEESEIPLHVQSIQENYLSALHWSMAYFFKGYISWNWQYSYSFAPFISEIFPNYDRLKIVFEKGTTFNALTYQLIMTHPTQSNLLPKPYQHLHFDSEIMDLWPFQYSSEFNWNFTEQVTIIPAFDVDRLLQVTQRYEIILEDEDMKKNRPGRILLVTKTQCLSEYPNQFRQQLEQEKHGLEGEVFYFKANPAKNAKKAYTYTYLAPISTQQQANSQLNGTTVEDREFQYNHEVAEQFDQVFYRGNGLIRQVERALQSNGDRNELHNKGQNRQQPQQNRQQHNQQRNQQSNRGGYQQQRGGQRGGPRPGLGRGGYNQSYNHQQQYQPHPPHYGQQQNYYPQQPNYGQDPYKRMKY